MSEIVTWKVLCYVVPDYKNKAAEELDVVIAAAEERGRRAGIEEAADKAYTAAHEAAEEIWKQHGAVQEAPCYQAAVAALRTIRKIESTLAPRDSGKGDGVSCGADEDGIHREARKDRK